CGEPSDGTADAGSRSGSTPGTGSGHGSGGGSGDGGRMRSITPSTTWSVTRPAASLARLEGATTSSLLRPPNSGPSTYNRPDPDGQPRGGARNHDAPPRASTHSGPS